LLLAVLGLDSGGLGLAPHEHDQSGSTGPP
jgi:hypothetical protein